MNIKVWAFYAFITVCTPIAFASTHALEKQKHVEHWMQTLDQHPFELVRKNAAMFLGDLQHRMAVPVLIKALDDQSPIVVMEAVKALGQLGDPQAIKPLYEKTVAQNNPNIADAARRSIEKIRAYIEFKKNQRDPEQ
jgi:HEAT repeat protein